MFMQKIKILSFPLTVLVLIDIILLIFRPFSNNEHWLDYLSIISTLMLVVMGWILKRNFPQSSWSGIFFTGLLIWTVIKLTFLLAVVITHWLLFRNAVESQSLLFGALISIVLFSPLVGACTILGGWMAVKRKQK